MLYTPTHEECYQESVIIHAKIWVFKKILTSHLTSCIAQKMGHFIC